MSGEDAAVVRRLRAEIRADRSAMEDRTAEVRQFAHGDGSVPPERPGALALALDRAYTALESILERVARTLEGGVPEGADWHRSLLQNASLEIERVRPAILGGEAVSMADEARRFRHFVRHGYAAPLDWERVRRVAQAWLADELALRRDLDAFDDFLGKLADRLDRPE
ncbi:MAG: hypothetical protein ACOC97_06045 [Myxococcota bacterium]